MDTGTRSVPVLRPRDSASRPALRRMRLVLIAAVAAATTIPLAAPAAAAPREGQSAGGLRTALPLIVIRTERAIVDRPKVAGTMRVIANRRGRLNRPSDPGTDYAGRIGIELRGRSSQGYRKKQYGLETRKASGKNENVSLLGLPKENDWVLSASAGDPSLQRDVLAYWTARRLGWYASRTRFVELILNGTYRGVYILMEKPKLDKNRVAVDDRDVTGGYLLESSQDDKLSPGDRFFRAPITRKPIVFYDPEGEGLSSERNDWISSYVSSFERALYGSGFRNPASGYRAYLDLRAAVDYALINEFFKNQDAFKSSTFLHKSVGGKLVLGPAWDFDRSMGRAQPRAAAQVRGWLLPSFPWAERLYRDPAFVQRMSERWRTLRRQGLLAGLHRVLDTNARLLREAQARNARRWPAAKGYGAETRRLKAWLTARTAWMDKNFANLRPTP